jgi:hypothetical protein
VLSVEPPVDVSTLRKVVCSGCDRYLFLEQDTTMATAVKWWRDCWQYPEGKCSTCPPEPMKERRSRCPICNEWITYIPDHPGHKSFVLGRWRRRSFKPANSAFLGHMNANAETHQGQPFVDAFYVATSDPAKGEPHA